MKKPRLNTASKKALRHSSSSQLQRNFKQLVGHIARQRWLRGSNRYAQRTIERIELHYRRRKINSPDLAEYIAASAPLHCMDGWGFLARAVDSTCRGDANAARHFAYY